MINKKLGYYQVNGQIFQHKRDAMIMASQTKSEVQWFFNNETYDRCNWEKEPDVSLERLYHIRAQQIRDQYDYVIVMASGGADSTNVIYSFLKNGIHIDEIIASAPMSGLRDWKWSDSDLRPENLISETKFAQFPLLDEIRNNWPNVKITINDYFEDILNYQTDEIINSGSFWMNLSSAKHYLEKFSHIKNLAESGKRIAKIYGTDKPILYKSQTGNIYSLIQDGTVGIGLHASTRIDYPNLEPVFFYFTPDLPEIIIKMSHVVANWMYLPGNEKALNLMATANMSKAQQNSIERISQYHRTITPIIYPALGKFDVFQTYKGLTGIAFLDADEWFVKLHGNTYAAQRIISDVNNFMNSVDQKFVYSDFNKLSVCLVHWKIGHENSFLKKYTEFKSELVIS
jgi:hypothetical protein